MDNSIKKKIDDIVPSVSEIREELETWQYLLEILEDRVRRAEAKKGWKKILHYTCDMDENGCLNKGNKDTISYQRENKEEEWCEECFKNRKEHRKILKQYDRENEKDRKKRSKDRKEWFLYDHGGDIKCKLYNCWYKNCGHETYYKGSYYLKGSGMDVYLCDMCWVQSDIAELSSSEMEDLF